MSGTVSGDAPQPDPAEGAGGASSSGSQGRGRSRKRDHSRRIRRKEILESYAAVSQAHEERARSLDLPWALGAAALVERIQVVTRDLHDWETDFYELRNTLSYYDAPEFPAGVEAGPAHPDEPEDTFPFELAPRETEADRSGDRQSLERALPESLYLVMRCKPGYASPSEWFLPQMDVQPGDMLGPTAVSAVETSCSMMPRLHHMNRQPIGHHYYEFEDSVKEERGQYGMKLFFFSSLVIDPYEFIHSNQTVQVASDGNYSDFEWLRACELKERISDEALAKYIEYIA